MFTGIVEELGTVAAVEDQHDAVRLTLRALRVLDDVAEGDSISVDGCCLTVADLTADTFTADVMRQTLLRTTLDRLRAGDRVNLERAVRVGGRLGGHLVQGHVDAVGRVRRRQRSEHWELLEVEAPADLLRYLVPQGSVTVDGTSLTVVDVLPDGFTVSLIPETLARTTLGFRAVGEAVNLEVDVIAKHVEKLVAPYLAKESR